MSEEPTAGVNSDAVGTELSCRETAWCHARRGQGQDACVPRATVVQPGVDEGLNDRHAIGRGGECSEEFLNGWNLQNERTTELWNMAPRGGAKNRDVTAVSCALHTAAALICWQVGSNRLGGPA